MKNMDVVKSLPPEALAALLVKEEVFVGGGFFMSLSGKSFKDYDDAIKDCVAWLNAKCE